MIFALGMPSAVPSERVVFLGTPSWGCVIQFKKDAKVCMFRKPRHSFFSIVLGVPRLLWLYRLTSIGCLSRFKGFDRVCFPSVQKKGVVRCPPFLLFNGIAIPPSPGAEVKCKRLLISCFQNLLMASAMRGGRDVVTPSTRWKGKQHPALPACNGPSSFSSLFSTLMHNPLL